MTDSDGGQTPATGRESRLHVSPRHRAMLEALIRERLPGIEVWAYGSRVNGLAHDGSDLDLALRGPGLKKIPAESLENFTEAVHDSTIPFLVEARDWARLPERFHREIEKEYVVLAEGEGGGDWREVTLGEIATLARETVRPSDLDKTKYVGLEHIRENTLSLIGHGFSSDVTSIKTRFSCGDILFGRLRPYFRKVVHARFDGICSTDIWVIRARQGIDQKFLFYNMASQSLVNFATSTSEGTRMPRAKWNYVSQYKITLPPIHEQRAIAHILGTLDDKIELNRRMNETLEEMARALFKYWFVDFGPVRAKMEGRWRRGESLPGLPAELYDLFPDRLVESELGEAPEGWETFCLNQLAHHHTKTVSPSRSPEIEHEHFSIPAYDTGQYPVIEPGSAIISNKTVMPSNSVLLSKLNPRISRVWMPTKATGHPQICSTELLVFTPRSHTNVNLLFMLFTNHRFRSLLKSMVTGTSKSHQRVPPKALKVQKILTGTSNIFTLFGKTTEGILTQILVNRSEIAMLVTIRDTLLPKLISGKIYIRKAEKMIEAMI